jgi:hypothetical protein
VKEQKKTSSAFWPWITIVLVICYVPLLFGPKLAPSFFKEPLVSTDQQSLLLVILLLYVVLLGIFQLRSSKQEGGPVSKEDTIADLTAKNRELTLRLKSLDDELSALSGEVREGRERTQELDRALNDAKARLSSSMARPATQASTQSIAEALQMLSLLQQRGRFVDFIMQDIAAIPNDQVGAVARFVHQGCRSVFDELFEIKPVRSEDEGSTITLDGAPDPEKLRLLGRTPTYPTTGKIIHRGWLTLKASLPKVTTERKPPYIIIPADAEL